MEKSTPNSDEGIGQWSGTGHQTRLCSSTSSRSGRKSHDSSSKEGSRRILLDWDEVIVHNVLELTAQEARKRGTDFVVMIRVSAKGRKWLGGVYCDKPAEVEADDRPRESE